LAAALLRVRSGDFPYPLICRLIISLKELPFECRKDVALIVTHLLERDEVFWEHVKKFNLNNYEEFKNNQNVKLLNITSSLRLLMLEGMRKVEEEATTSNSNPETDETVAEESNNEAESSSNPSSSELSVIEEDHPALKQIPDMMQALVNGCGFPEVSLNCGVTIRTAIKDPVTAQRLFASPELYIFPFFEATYVNGYEYMHFC
jgi:hypothetical protein